ncbi:MAG: class IV adenylate cyclase [Acidobacteriia bacterium]|nr:class IV adenylate cyclase [Terriglobia bacterium]
MARETEIKLRIPDRKLFLRALRKLHARAARGSAPVRVHEFNVIFDTPDGGLAKHGQLLRIRTETPRQGSRKKRGAPPARVICTFKSPVASVVDAAGPHKVREEREVEVASAELLTRIFEGLGLRGWFRYEKYRTTYLLPAAVRWARGLLIELDETPIGTFVELEGPAAAIDRAAALLGYSRRDYLLTNYLQLYLDDCRRRGQPPRDMLFAKRP